MKRDLDLIRDMLMVIEAAPSDLYLRSEDFLGACNDLDKIVYHLKLLNDAGLIQVLDTSTKLGDDFLVERMTFAGHDYLDAIRDKAIWEKIKDKLIPFGGQVSLDIVKELGVAFVKQQLML